ncbi:hypothetical protein NE848_09110 [Gramella jeungdoensis]|uniref:Uncharacterized protein n=1 Tax=Gramella jeungdoensis TaxID=708091 RepID=A0ABT0Z1D9_9FLAO|nr:hypothetical protein [Gramella jeungdoensis]MCM8569538.1 hypothetical protein [Gramella jeungdoensis]
MSSEDIDQYLLIRAQEVDKRKRRVALFFYIIPILYFLLQFSVIKEIKLWGFNITQIEIINLITPVVYSLFIFYYYFLNEDFKALKSEVVIPEKTKEDVSFFYSRSYLFFPPNLIFEVLRNMRYRNWFSEFGTIFIFSPLALVILIGPLLFLAYSIYISGWGLTISKYNLNFICSGLSLWIFIATYLYTHNRKNEPKR